MLTVVAAAIVAGFTGFGAALIFMPVASAALGARVAPPGFLITDFILTLPMFVGAARHCHWPTVLPAAIGAILTAPLGALVLAGGDPSLLRWALSIVVIMLLALIMSGWRYHREPAAAISTGVGGLAGLLGGFGQVAGPPVIALWVSGPRPAFVIRANMFVFLALFSVSSFAAYMWNGLFTGEVFRMIAVVAPPYALALYAGSRLFRHTSGTGYRPLAYGVIAVAAITSIPALDGVLRRPASITPRSAWPSPRRRFRSSNRRPECRHRRRAPRSA